MSTSCCESSAFDLKKIRKNKTDVAKWYSCPLKGKQECRLEVAGDVISGVAEDYVGINVRVNFGDSLLNSG